MKKRKKKNGITLLALVITIIIMLLLAGVAIQMTMGENGLIGKSVQAQKEQAKAELYDTAKLSYMSLNAKALENGQPRPQAELALSTTEFTNKYNVVGDDITDKKGTVIDTKANVLNIIQGIVAGGFTPGTTPGTTTSAESLPKVVAGVTITEEDKDKMILKLKVNGNRERIKFWGGSTSIISIDYGNGNSDQNLILNQAKYVEYTQGEYVLKISKIVYVLMDRDTQGDYEIEVLQWGKIAIKNNENSIRIWNVSKVYEPEPDRVTITYKNAKFTEIPEWLFSKKVTSEVMSVFSDCTGLTSIPEGLFKNNVNVKYFGSTFYGCTGLTSIPERLFEHNVKVRAFESTFQECTGLTSIPVGLFKNNVNTEGFGSTFYNCTGLTSIPEGLFNNNVNATYFFGNTFEGCTGLTSIPEGLFKYNVNATNFGSTFYNCTGLTSIPEGLFKNNVNVKYFESTFGVCTGLTSIPEGLFKNNVKATGFRYTFYVCTGLTSIPEGLFKNNVKVKNFESAFSDCKGLTSIPEGLFKNNVNATNFHDTFIGCRGITSIPEKIIEFGKKVKEKGGDVSRMFLGCTLASNYNSIPNYMK